MSYITQTQQALLNINLTVDNITSSILNDLIKEHLPNRTKLKTLWSKYAGNVPIKKRQSENYLKVNNKLSHDFRGQIVEQVVGYMFGVPIVYTINRTKYTDKQYADFKNKLDEFLSDNNYADLDSTTGEYASVCGYGARLLYVDPNAVLRSMNIAPWEVIFIDDQTINELQYAIIYYPMQIQTELNKFETRWRLEVYDKQNVAFYIEKEPGVYVLDQNEPINPAPHNFDQVPVIKFDNNNLHQGDFESVQALIDAYDELISTAQDEIQELRLAYLVTTGGTITLDNILLARKTGAFNTPEGGDIKFITKSLPYEFYENQKKTLRENIYLISDTVDFSNSAFNGNAESGISRKLKFQGLESKTIKKERKFQKGLQDQFKVIQSLWEKLKIPFNYKDMSFRFSRNLPKDILYLAEILQKLNGQLSKQTAFEIVSDLVPDAEVEIARMKKEYEDLGLTFDLNTFNTGE